MAATPMFPRLFEPVKIGKMELRNRIAMPPMETNFGTEDGFVTQRSIDYYARRAEGGAGLIIIECTAIEYPRGKGFPCHLAVNDDKYIPQFKKLTEAIHSHGAKTALQLQHSGVATKSALTGMQPVGPSSVAVTGGELPRELTTDEVKDLVRKFADAAGRAKKAGFDAVEIHAAHYYLVAQFLSPAMNKRTDMYGGSLENRARFLVEIIKAIKGVTGADFPVWCRINGEEYGLPGALTHEEARKVARIAEEAGANAIHVSSWDLAHISNSSLGKIESTNAAVWGYQAHLAAGIKQAVKVPVIAVGRINAEIGEEIIREGKADLVAIGRGLIADPDLPVKAKEGRPEDINRCVACGTCTRNPKDLRKIGYVSCLVNATAGKEREYRLGRAAKQKNVVVVGGGPGGMEAARVAAIRGHKVTLFEAGDDLGGQLHAAWKPPYKGELERLATYLKAQVRKTGVDVRLNTSATADSVVKAKPDAVILASGAEPNVPNIPGIKGSNVVFATDVLLGRKQPGKIVVVIGGGMVGCETAEFLARQGKKVAILEMLPDIANDMPPVNKRAIVHDLGQSGVVVETNAKVEEINAQGVKATCKGGSKFFDADTVILAAGMKSRKGLEDELKAKGLSVKAVGDCVEPGDIKIAIDDAYAAAKDL